MDRAKETSDPPDVCISYTDVCFFCVCVCSGGGCLQLNGLDSRDLVCRELGLSESEVNKNSPLLLELVRRGQLKDKPSVCTEVRHVLEDEPRHSDFF